MHEALARNAHPKDPLQQVAVGLNLIGEIVHFALKFAWTGGHPKLPNEHKVHFEKARVNPIKQGGHRHRAAMETTPEHLALIEFRSALEVIAEEFFEGF